MKRSTLIALIGFTGIMLVFMVSCNSAAEKSTSEESAAHRKPSPAESPPAKTAEAEFNPKDHSGYGIYKQHCLACHQASGGGVPGMFPPIMQTEWVNGDPGRLIKIILFGMDETIEVNGEVYSAVMAGLPYLTDQEVADVLNYVRLDFGNGEDLFTATMVADVRKQSRTN